MNGNSALLDSNILIYLSKNELPFSILDQFTALFVSVISYMEDFKNIDVRILNPFD